MRKTTRLRQLLDNGEFLIMPCAYDGLSAKIVQAMGIKATYISGYALAASMLGAPDAGLASHSEVTEQAGRIADAVDIPLLCDADQGWGPPLTVARTIRMFEKQGLAGTEIDDQVSEVCPYLPIERQLIPPEEMVAKIRAGTDALEDKDFVLTCKASVLSTVYEREGRYQEEYARRAKMYVKAGAYSVITGARTVDDLRFFAGVMRDLGRPAVAVLGSYMPQINVADLKAMGYQVLIYPVDAMYASIKAQMDTIRDLLSNGDLTHSLPNMLSHRDFIDLIGIPKVQEHLDRYASYIASASA